MNGIPGQKPAAEKNEVKKEKKKEKESKKEVESEPAEELDAADLALASEPKSKDPFAEMPKG